MPLTDRQQKEVDDFFAPTPKWERWAWYVALRAFWFSLGFALAAWLK